MSPRPVGELADPIPNLQLVGVPEPLYQVTCIKIGWKRFTKEKMLMPHSSFACVNGNLD